MNVAIMFFGQFRWFDQFHKSFAENVLPTLNGHTVRYFAHFWNIANQQDSRLEDFKQLYKPYNIIVENQKSDEEMLSEFNSKSNMHKALLSQTYSFYKTNKLLEQHPQYEKFNCFIKLRSDLVFLNKINLDFDEESIYTKNISHWRPISNYVHDYALFTRKRDNVKTLANLGFNFDNIISKEKLLYTGGPNEDHYCCEEILARHLVINNINIKSYTFNIDLARYHL